MRMSVITGENKRDEITSVLRAITLLNALADRDGPMTVLELSRETRLPRTTVYRLVRSLVSAGVLEEAGDGSSERYSLGLGLLKLTFRMLRKLDIRELARPHLEALARGTGETALLSVLTGREAVYVDKVDSPRSLRMAADIGRPRPLYSTATGRAQLAFLPADSWEKFIPSSLPRYTDRTITDRARLMELLEDIRSRGYAVDDQEFEEGLYCISAPIFRGPGQVVGSITVAGPSSRFGSNRLKELVPKLKDAAHAISRSLMLPVVRDSTG